MKYTTIPDPGGDLCYHDFPGDRTAIVYLHGLGTAGSSWFPPCTSHPGLRDHRSILIDLLGYGYSDRPKSFNYTMEAHTSTVAFLLDDLGLTQSIVVGHSMGGSIAILLAHLRPDLVGSLVVAEGNLDPGPGMFSRIITSVSEQEFIDTGYDQFVRDTRSMKDRDYAHSLRATDPAAIHRSAVSLIASRTPTYRDCLLALDVPKAYLYGSKTVSSSDEKALRESGIQVAIVPNSGHDMMADNPVGFCDTLRVVIDKLESEPEG